MNDTATTEIYTLSLHDALPIFEEDDLEREDDAANRGVEDRADARGGAAADEHRHVRAGERERPPRSEEHTSELQSRQYPVCRLLLEQKQKTPPHLSEYTHGRRD